MYCLVVDLTISVLVSVGLLLHDVELVVGGKAAKGFPEQQCLGAEARRGGFVKWLPCYAEEQVYVDSGVYHEPDPDNVREVGGWWAAISAMLSAMAPSSPWEEAP